VFKHCPSCRSEFQEWVATCPDCRVPLVAPGTPLPPPEAPEVLPAASELVAVERGLPAELRTLAEAFQHEGIASRIDAAPGADGVGRGAVGPNAFALYVREVDLPTAVRVRNAHLERVVPDAAGLTAGVGAELAACPACEAPLAEGAAECESCGLEFPDVSAED